MAEATQVLYDVRQPIAAMQKLDRAVKRAVIRTRKALRDVNNSLGLGSHSFQQIGGDIHQFGRALRRVNPELANLVAATGRLAASAGPTGLAVAGIGAAVAVVAANVFDLSGALRDADAVSGRFLKNQKELQSFLENISRGEDRQREIQLDNTRRAVAERKFLLATRQNAIDIRKERAQQELTIEKRKLGQIEAAQKAARRRRLTAEQRLAEKLAESSVVGAQFAGRPTGRQVTDLAARAQQEAQRGNIDAAEVLIDRAKQLSNELGDHVFFTRQIDQANNAVIKALQQNVRQAKNQEKSLTGQIAQQDQVVAKYENLIDREKARTAEITRQNRLLGQQGSLIEQLRKRDKQLQEVQRGASDTATGLRAARQEVQSRLNEGTLARAIDRLSDGLRGLIDVRNIRNIGRDRDIITDLNKQVLTQISALSRPGTTPADIRAASDVSQQVQQAVQSLQVGLEQGTTSEALRRQITLLENLNATLKSAVTGFPNFASLDQSRSIAGQAGQLSQEIEGTQRQLRAAEQQLTINVNVQGGPIDGEVVRQLEPQIKRAARAAVTDLRAN